MSSLENHMVLGPYPGDDWEPETRFTPADTAPPRSHFTDAAHSLFRDVGPDLPFDRLNERDQRRLTAAYLRDTPDAMADIADAFATACIADAVAGLVEQPTRRDALMNNDCIAFAHDIWEVLWPNRGLLDQVEAEFNHAARYYRKHCVPALLQRQAD